MSEGNKGRRQTGGTPRSSRHIDTHAGWAMAVGGMIGGGIYTLAGVILGLAGPLAWVSLLLGSLLALVTVRSYFYLTTRLQRGGIPVTLLKEKKYSRLAGVLAWWLILVYVLAMGVYSFTFGHYVGRALKLSDEHIALVTVGMVAALTIVNLLGIKEPAGVQKAAVWTELLILTALAVVGFCHWHPENLVSGVPGPSAMGVFAGTAGTFIAFEGFEMLAYDYRELRAPRRIMGKALAAAVLAVGLAYALVTVGAASLVGAHVLVQQKENALAVAGAKAAGTTGLIIVTVAACASAASAVNATLFSVARLARSTAEQKLMPSIFARCNHRKCPHYSIIALAAVSTALAAMSSLELLVQTASLAFLLLFGLVNTLAWLEEKRQNWLSFVGALGTVGAAVFEAQTLAWSHPWILAGFIGACLLAASGFFVTRSWRKRHSHFHGGRRAMAK